MPSAEEEILFPTANDVGPKVLRPVSKIPRRWRSPVRCAHNEWRQRADFDPRRGNLLTAVEVDVDQVFLLSKCLCEETAFRDHGGGQRGLEASRLVQQHDRTLRLSSISFESGEFDGAIESWTSLRASGDLVFGWEPDAISVVRAIAGRAGPSDLLLRPLRHKKCPGLVDVAPSPFIHGEVAVATTQSAFVWDVETGKRAHKADLSFPDAASTPSRLVTSLAFGCRSDEAVVGTSAGLFNVDFRDQASWIKPAFPTIQFTPTSFDQAARSGFQGEIAAIARSPVDDTYFAAVECRSRTLSLIDRRRMHGAVVAWPLPAMPKRFEQAMWHSSFPFASLEWRSSVTSTGIVEHDLIPFAPGRHAVMTASFTQGGIDPVEFVSLKAEMEEDPIGLTFCPPSSSASRDPFFVLAADGSVSFVASEDAPGPARAPKPRALPPRKRKGATSKDHYGIGLNDRSRQRLHEVPAQARLVVTGTDDLSKVSLSDGVHLHDLVIIMAALGLLRPPPKTLLAAAFAKPTGSEPWTSRDMIVKQPEGEDAEAPALAFLREAGVALPDGWRAGDERRPWRSETVLRVYAILGIHAPPVAKINEALQFLKPLQMVRVLPGDLEKAATIEVAQTASGILITSEVAATLAGLWPDTGRDFKKADFRKVKRWLQSANQAVRRQSREAANGAPQRIERAARSADSSNRGRAASDISSVAPEFDRNRSRTRASSGGPVRSKSAVAPKRQRSASSRSRNGSLSSRSPTVRRAFVATPKPAAAKPAAAKKKMKGF